MPQETNPTHPEVNQDDRQTRIKFFIEKSLQLAKENKAAVERSLQERNNKKTDGTFKGWLKKTFLGDSQAAYERDSEVLKELDARIALLEASLATFPRLNHSLVKMVKNDLFTLVNNSVFSGGDGYTVLDVPITEEELRDFKWVLEQSLVFLETLDPYKYLELRDLVHRALQEQLRLVEAWPSDIGASEQPARSKTTFN